MGRKKDINKILTKVIEPLLESITSGQYKLEDATMEIGSHRIVFEICIQPRQILKLDKHGDAEISGPFGNPNLN